MGICRLTPNVYWKSISLEQLRSHPQYTPLPACPPAPLLPSSHRQVTMQVCIMSSRSCKHALIDSCALACRLVRQDSPLWDALHRGVLTSGSLNAALGFYEHTQQSSSAYPSRSGGTATCWQPTRTCCCQSTRLSSRSSSSAAARPAVMLHCTAHMRGRRRPACMARSLRHGTRQQLASQNLPCQRLRVAPAEAAAKETNRMARDGWLPAAVLRQALQPQPAALRSLPHWQMLRSSGRLRACAVRHEVHHLAA